MSDRKMGFWDFASENPVLCLLFGLILIGAVALLCGYSEGFISVVSGIFGFTKSDDNTRKLRQQEIDAKNRALIAENESKKMYADIEEQRIAHDEGVDYIEGSAKAECDDMDIDELVDIGNAMLAEHGALRGEAS